MHFAFFCVHKIGVCRPTSSFYGLTWYLYMDLLELVFLALLPSAVLNTLRHTSFHISV